VVQVRYDDGVAIHIDPEPCVIAREGERILTHRAAEAIAWIAALRRLGLESGPQASFLQQAYDFAGGLAE
jgi:hypothetical protein